MRSWVLVAALQLVAPAAARGGEHVPRLMARTLIGPLMRTDPRGETAVTGSTHLDLARDPDAFAYVDPPSPSTSP